jgi:hypothetical protein
MRSRARKAAPASRKSISSRERQTYPPITLMALLSVPTECAPAVTCKMINGSASIASHHATECASSTIMMQSYFSATVQAQRRQIAVH